MSAPWTGSTLATLLGVAATSCSTGAEKFQREHVSEGLRELSGQELGPGDGSLPPGFDATDGISEEEAVTVALWNNPTFQFALAELGIRRADLVQAGELPNPWFWFLAPVGQKTIEYNVRIPFEALWQRPARVDAARADCERTAQQLMQGGLDLERDVRLAFAELRWARARHALLDERARTQRAIGEFTAHRFAAGDASRLEVSTSDAAATRSAVESIRAEQVAELAESRARALLGAVVPMDAALIEGVADSAPQALDSQSLLSTAHAMRPDLRGADLALEAAGERVGLSTAQVMQAQLLADFSGNGRDFQGGPGVFFTVPILNQGEGGRMRAEAELQQALLRRRALAQQIEFEVRDALARRSAAVRMRDGCHSALAPLQLTAQAAEKAWQSGDQSQLPGLEARLALLDGLLLEADADNELARATAELRRNIGGRLP